MLVTVFSDMLRVVIVVALLVITISSANSELSDQHAEPTPKARLAQQCAGYCKASTKFDLREGSTYVYDYVASSVSHVSGTSNRSSEVKISAKALIHVTANPCDLILQIQESKIYDSGEDGLEISPKQKEFSSQLEQSALRFSFQDGRVDQLCPSSEELPWALNLKRGVLSALQNSMRDLTNDARLYERDVSGYCDTVYTVKPSMWNDARIFRQKELHSCSNRVHQTLGLPKSVADQTKSTPIIKSEQFCDQTINTVDGPFISRVKCVERHTFAPFSNKQSGINTIAELSLSLEKIVEDSTPIATELFINKRTTLQLDLSEARIADDAGVSEDDVWHTLGQLTQHTTHGVDKETPQLFSQLINQLEYLDDQQLVRLFDEQKEVRVRKFLVDALPLVGSAASVKAMFEIYNAQEVTKEELHSWLTALAFHKQPTLELLHNLNLFIQDSVEPKSWLAVSSVVHSYCQLDPACADTQEVRTILSQIEQVLGESCHTRAGADQTIIVALKAVGNAGLITSVDTIKRCFLTESNPLEVRLAAVSALRRFPCSTVQRLPLLELFQSHSQDTELRIAAYLTALQCPTTAVVSRVRDALYEEDTNQVLSFVWTHLTNLQESSASWRREVRQMLQDSFLVNKFKTDARKFSRNYEMSFYSDLLNAGAAIDSNVIFNSKSYLPRSATLNLTFDLFGESVNIFEFGTRMEGFESMVEEVFSKKGFFPDESMEKMLKNMRKDDNEKNEVIQSFSDQFTKGTVNEPQGSMFARVFGNELYLTQFNSLKDLLYLQTDKKYSQKNLLDSLSSLFNGRNIDHTKSFRILNTKYSVPTILGLPLHLEVNSTATVGFQLQTEIDMSNILKTKSGTVSFKVNPSVAVRVDGKMLLDAVFTQAGVETKGTLSSNTYLDTRISVDKGQIVDVSLNVPRDKVEVVNVLSQIFLKRREKLEEIKGIGEITESDTCSGTHVPTVSGMRLCSQIFIRNASAVENAPYFPLTGRFQYALVLHKSDSFDAYKLHLNQLFESSKGKYNGKFLLEVDTPGSKLDRRLYADLTFNSKDGNAHLEMVSPQGSFLFSGKLGLSSAEKSMDLKAQVNGEDFANINVALATASNANSIKYEPRLLVMARPNLNINVTGRLNIVPGNKYSADLTASGLTYKPIVLSGDVSTSKGRYQGSLAAKAEAVDVKMNVKVLTTASMVSCKTLVRYVLRQRDMHTLDFAAKLQNHKKGGFTKKHLVLNLQMSELPEYSTKTTWILYRNQKYLDSNIDLTLGKTQWKSQQMYHNNMMDKNKNFEIILSLESPTKKLDYRTEVQYKVNEGNIHAHTLAQLSKTKQFISRLDYQLEYPLHSLELELASPWKRVFLGSTVELSSGDSPWNSVVNSSVVCKWGDIQSPHWVSVKAVYKMGQTFLSTQHMVRGEVEVEGWKQPVQLEGEWRAESADGLILSDIEAFVLIDKDSYTLNVKYVKDPILEKHDVKVTVAIPLNTYTSSLHLINNQEVKNLTLRLDLEKTLYFTTQLKPWKEFDLQLFWDYQTDLSESVMVQYRNSATTELAVVSMPGHYAALTVDKLGPGLSSMNVTAMWGESEGSANNVILLSTYWLLDMTPWYAEALWLPTIQTRVQLVTPFLGFEQQSFLLHVNGSSGSNPSLGPVTREIQVSTNWQDQHVNLEVLQVEKTSTGLEESNMLTGQTEFAAKITSSLETLREARFTLNVADTVHSTQPVYFVEKSCVLDASYNDWGEFSFNSTRNQEITTVYTSLRNKTDDQVVFSANVALLPNSVSVSSVLPLNKKVEFKSAYQWPKSFKTNLKTSFQGYEESSVEYSWSTDANSVKASVLGNFGDEYLQSSADLKKTLLGFQGVLDLSTSSSLPDLSLMVEHELRRMNDESYIKEFASVVLKKKGKTLQTGQALLLYIAEMPTRGSYKKSLQTVLELPGHFSSSNYSFDSQVKITGYETHHQFVHLWNKDKTEGSLALANSLSSVSAFLKRNNDKKAEFYFKKDVNGNYRTDINLSGGYSIKHRLFFKESFNWENFLMVSSNKRKVNIKNVQTLNEAKTAFNHKSTVSIDKEVSYLDLNYSIEPSSSQIENALFSVSTPWNHPVVAKYDLLLDTGVAKKHEIILRSQNKETQIQLDTIQSDSQFALEFSALSPYATNLNGKIKYEFNERQVNGISYLTIENKSISVDFELIKSFRSPVLTFNFNSSDENLIHAFGTYNIESQSKRLRLLSSYKGQEVSLKSHYSNEENTFKTGFMLNTPFMRWMDVSADLESIISQEHSKFVISTKKDEHFAIISAEGTFESDSMDSSLSLDYNLGAKPQKHLTVFELNKESGNFFTNFEYVNDEKRVLDFNMKYSKAISDETGKSVYTLSYEFQSLFETPQRSDLELLFTNSDGKQVLSGAVRVNDWEGTITGENTMAADSIGYLDVKLISPERKVELYLKHIIDDKDTYTCRLSNNAAFISTTVLIANNDDGISAQYYISSSVEEVKEINGVIGYSKTLKSASFESTTNVNENAYILKYNAHFGTPEEGEQTLVISMPKTVSEDIKGTLKYTRLLGRLMYLQGEVSKGTTTNKLLYAHEFFDHPDRGLFVLDLPGVFKCSSRKTASSLEVTAVTVKSERIPDFSLNLAVNQTYFLLETNNTLTDKLQFVMDYSDSKIDVTCEANNLIINACFEKDSESVNLDLKSNIPNWTVANCVAKYKLIDKVNDKFSLLVSRERNELFYGSVEGFHNKQKGDRMATIVMESYFADISFSYDFSSNFTADLQYNINGDKKQVGGKMSFLPDSSRIDLATPIKGFEDLTFLGTVNRNNKKVGLVFQKNGKTIDIELSAIVESEVITLKGTLKSGKDEYVLTFGTKTGSSDDPAFTSFYLSALKNSQMMFWISLEGAYNPQKKTGVKFSFSCVNYKQIYLEIISETQDSKHLVLFSYLYGIDVVYLLKSEFEKNVLQPALTINLEFNALKHFLYLMYDIESERKFGTVEYKRGDTFVHLFGEITLSPISSNLKLNFVNEGMLNLLNHTSVAVRYNFTDSSLMNIQLQVNGYKYFNLNLASQSLYSVAFESFLIHSNYLKMSYDVGLNYEFAKPNSFVFSKINMSGDYYLLSTNLTWDEQTADLSLRLDTDKGYGFKTADLSAKYVREEILKNSYLIGFKIDESHIFYVKLNFDLPNTAFINLSLPDSLFLPFTKKITATYNMTDVQKQISMKYASQSVGLKECNFFVNKDKEQFLIYFDRSIEEDESKSIDRFVFSFKDTPLQWDLKSHILLENENMFAVSYTVDSLGKSSNVTSSVLHPDTPIPTKKSISLENIHSWKISVGSEKVFDFTGNFSPKEKRFSLKHLSTAYHQLAPSEIVIQKQIQTNNVLNIHYTNEQLTNLDFKYSDMSELLSTIAKPGELLSLSSDVKVTWNENVHILHKEDVCADAARCSKLEETITYVNVYKGKEGSPASFHFILDREEGEFQIEIIYKAHNYNTGGTFKRNPEVLMCSDFQVYFNSTANPQNPFSLKYETNCQNSLKLSLNPFKKTMLRLNGQLEYDHLDTYGIKIETENLPILKDLNIFGEVNKAMTYISFTMNTAYEVLKQLEVTSRLDTSNSNFYGKFVIGQQQILSTFNIDVIPLSNGSFQCVLSSNKGYHMEVLLDSVNKEMTGKLENNGVLYEGKGGFNFLSEGPGVSADAHISINEKEYKLKFTRSVSAVSWLGEQRNLLTLTTPSDTYKVNLVINKVPDALPTFIFFKYKTPFQCLDHGELSIERVTEYKYRSGSVRLSEFDATEENEAEKYETDNTQMTFKFYLKTENVYIHDALLVFTYGNEHSIYLEYLTDSVLLSLENYENTNLKGVKGVLDIKGFENNTNLQSWIGTSIIKALRTKVENNYFASVKSPLIDRVVFIKKCVNCESNSEISPVQKLLEISHLSRVYYANETIFELKFNSELSNLSLVGKWNNEYKAHLNYTSNKNTEFEIDVWNKNQQVVLALFNSDNIKTNTFWSKRLQLHVQTLFSLPPIHPFIIFKKHELNTELTKYSLDFDNGITTKDLSLKGNLSIELSDLAKFSLKSATSIKPSVILTTSTREYECNGEIVIQPCKFDSILNWRKKSMLINIKQNLDFSIIRFGGSLEEKAAEIYINDNKFNASIENSPVNTLLTANFYIEKTKKTYTLTANIQNSPLYQLTVSHTFFENPCSVEIKINRLPQSIESAMTIAYNNLQQQAFINVYLDGEPKYAELMYIDIWQQTHEASIHVSEKEDEVTVRSKVESPAMDEHFLIITIGNNNDKLDLNLNDAFILKAFKDEVSGYLDLFISENNYKVQYKNENETEIKLVSPKATGEMKFFVQGLDKSAFLQSAFDVEKYHLVLEVNQEKLFNLALTNDNENILKTSLDIENNMDVLQLDMKFDSFENLNSFSLKHIHNPTLLRISLNSPYYLQNNLDLAFAISNNNSGSLDGLLSLHQDKSVLFNGHLLLDKLNRTLLFTVEAPMFSKMDKGEINAIFNTVGIDSEMKLSAYLSSEGSIVSQASAYYIKNDIFATGLVIKSNLNNFEDFEISVHSPITLSRDMKVAIVSHLPFGNIYEFSSSVCMMESGLVTTANAKWRNLIMSLEYKLEENPFYGLLQEMNINFLKKKVQIGAWMDPKKPITDYIYFLNIDGKQIIEVSHALLIEQNHFKCKLIVETQFKSHHKYGIDLELQDLKIGKIVRLLGSAPVLGENLGIDFGYNYESLLNYGVIVQAKIPFGKSIKQVRLNSMNKIHSNLKFSKLNHSLECSGVGIISWEFESYGSVPFIWQEDLSAIETKINFNNNVYSLKTKTFLQSNKIQLTLGIETPYDQTKGEIHFAGTKDLVGSDLSISLNSMEVVNVNITKDAARNNHIVVLSKWRNIALKYLYETEKTTRLNGYVCWDLLKRNASQLGLEFKAGWNNLRYETDTEILLPSLLIPKLGLKTAFENEEKEHFSLMQLDLPTLTLEGKLAREISNGALKTGSQIKWSSEKGNFKNIGLFFVGEKTDEETRMYVTLQHFALENDLMLSLYSVESLFGLNLQYSPIKDEEITVEAGYWVVEDGDKERSGVKFVILHPVSDTLVYTVANMTSTKEYIQTGMSIAYIGNEDRNKVKYIEVFGKKNKKTPEIFFGLASDGNSMGVGGSVWKKDNYLQGVTLEARVNQKDPLRLEVVQNLGNPGVEAELSYSPNRNYRIYAGMPNSNELTARLSHSTYGKSSMDALASLRLNTSRILWGRFELPSMAEVGQEFFGGVAEEYSEASLVSQAIARGFSEFVQEDFSKKVILLLNSINEKSNLMIQKTGLEMESVLYGIKEMERLMQMVYQEDHFYVKTGHQYLQSAVSAVYGHLSRSCGIFAKLARDMFKPIADVALHMWNVVSPVVYQWVAFVRDLKVNNTSPVKQLTSVLENYQTLRVSLVLYGKQAVTKTRAQLVILEHKSADLLAQAELTVNQLARTAEEVVNEQLRRLQNFRDTILAGFTELKDTVKGMLEIVLEGVYRIREVRHSVGVAVKCLDSVTSWFINFRLESYLRELDRFVERVAKLVSSDFQKNFGEYEVYLVKAKLILDGHYEEINKIPQVQYIKIAVNNVYQKIKWFWNYAKLSDRVRDAARRYLENAKAALDDLESKLEREEGDLRSEYSYIAENNSFVFTQELPFEWKAFDHLPEYNMDLNSRTWTIPAQEYSNMVSTMANYLWQDAKLLPYLLPGFSTEAFISGDSFITFDNSFYHFSGDCNSYLLAGDLYHNTFSLIVNYNTQNDKDILLITDNDEVLLKNNLEVFVNGRKQDLPAKAGSTKSVTIERKIHSVSIQSNRGLSVECSSYQDVCIVRLDGWFMGKTAGLLGTYSNEPSDDLISPSRQSVDNIKEFTDSWALDTRSCENREDLLSDEEVKPDESMCELFFTSQSSPFFPCFHVVNPSSFYDMCISQQRKDYTCPSVMAYLTKCTTSGVQLWMPDFCAGSSLTRANTVSTDSDSALVPVQHSADVVVLLESASCVTEELDVPALLTGLDTDLHDKGMYDNQFSFISFDSQGAQILTVQGQPWTNNTRHVAQAIRRMGVGSESGSVSAYQAALDLASSLAYRPGVSKLVLLLHCSSCPLTDGGAGVLEHFTESDITLHVLQRDAILGKKGKTVSKAVGLEKSGAYPRKRLSKNTSPSPQLLQQVSVPQDMCSTVMLGTNGTLFSMEVVKKSTQDVWTGRVARGAVPLTDMQQCVRSVGRDNVPIWRCRSSSQPDKIQDWDQTALEEYLDTSRAEDIYPEYEENDR